MNINPPNDRFIEANIKLKYYGNILINLKLEANPIGINIKVYLQLSKPNGTINSKEKTKIALIVPR